jgi:hypothetical protein
MISGLEEFCEHDDGPLSSYKKWFPWVHELCYLLKNNSLPRILFVLRWTTLYSSGSASDE